MKKLLLFFVLTFVYAGIAHTQIPTNGLVRYYPFTGNAADYTPNAQHGTVVGATLTTDRFGTANAAYYFDGNNDYIEIPANDLALNQYSYSAWAQLSTLPSDGNQYMVLDIGSNSGGGDQYVNVANHYLGNFHGWGIGGYHVGGGQYYSQPDINPAANQWVHLVSIRSANKIKFYFNGILAGVDSTTNATTPSYGVNAIQGFIGIRNDFTFFFNGKIDDIRIYNRPLNEPEVLTLYQEGLCLQSIAVTDTLVINTNITSYNPLAYENSIKIFPNPTHDHIYIDCGDNYASISDQTIRITNSLGQQMYETQISQQQFLVDLSSWSGNGTYFVYLVDAQGNIREVRKIILQ